MNYDVYGSFSPSVGPNAPLNDSCAPSPQGSAVSGVKSWTDAGFPHHKIVLGVAGYGHSFHVNSSSAFNGSAKVHPYVPFDKSQQPAGDKLDSTAGDTDVCGNPTVVGGVFNFWGLIYGGFLNAEGKPAKGIDYAFDNCSQTVSDLRRARNSDINIATQPFVYNQTSQVMVSYDNDRSFSMAPLLLLLNLSIHNPKQRKRANLSSLWASPGLRCGKLAQIGMTSCSTRSMTPSVTMRIARRVSNRPSPGSHRLNTRVISSTWTQPIYFCRSFALGPS